jgi:hypothetical protein
MKGRPDTHNIASGRAMYIYIFLHYFLIYSISNSFSHIFFLNNLFLWTIKHSLRILLSFLVVKLILVIYQLNFILKMVNNTQDITSPSAASSLTAWGSQLMSSLTSCMSNASRNSACRHPILCFHPSHLRPQDLNKSLQ